MGWIEYVLASANESPVNAARMERVDTTIQMVGAVVGQELEGGRYFYRPNPDGTFGARLLMASGLGERMLKELLNREAIRIVSEIRHDC